MSLKASSSSNPMLPISDPPGDEDRDKPLRGEEKLFKGSAMTKRGAYAAISYMSCAGKNYQYDLDNYYYICMSFSIVNL